MIRCCCCCCCCRKKTACIADDRARPAIRWPVSHCALHQARIKRYVRLAGADWLTASDGTVTQCNANSCVISAHVSPLVIHHFWAAAERHLASECPITGTQYLVMREPCRQPAAAVAIATRRASLGKHFFTPHSSDGYCSDDGRSHDVASTVAYKMPIPSSVLGYLSHSVAKQFAPDFRCAVSIVIRVPGYAEQRAIAT